MIPIPHEGRKPDWLEPETIITIRPPTQPGDQAGAHGFFIGQVGGYAWSYLTPRKHVFLPADHWAAPVLLHRVKTGEDWWPWNPLLQGDGPPSDYAGGKVMTRDGRVSHFAAYWTGKDDATAIIGYERSLTKAQPQPSAGEVCGEREATIGELLDEFAVSSLEETAKHLDGLRVRLGRDNLEMDEWNALCDAAMTCRLEARRRLPAPPKGTLHGEG